MTTKVTLNMKKEVFVRIDRPIGYVDAYGNRYPVNYGYVPGILGGDGEEQDVYVLGIDSPIMEYTGTVVAVIHRQDDVEDKWVVSRDEHITKEMIREQTYFMEKYFESEIEML